MTRLRRIRASLSYANVMATVAVFVALGGTGYAAVVLPRDSVGSRELRSRSVGASELKSGAVVSSSVRDGSLQTRDLSARAREELTGAQGASGAVGPAGPTGVPGAKGETGSQGPPGKSVATEWAVVNDAGTLMAGTAVGSVPVPSPGESVVTFSRSVSGCAPVATLAKIPGGFGSDPTGGTIAVEVTPDGKVHVHTRNAGGGTQVFGFHLIVVCP